jgi:putative hydrolase of the HAD superfamily
MTLRAFDRDIQLVSFDLDDTLVDTLASVPPRVRAALTAMQPRLPRVLPDEAIDEIADFVAQGDPDLRPTRLLGALELAHDDPVAVELIESYAANDHLIDATAGAAGVMKRLSERVTVVVITNGAERIQSGKLRRNGLNEFVSALVCSEEVGVRKPDAGIFMHACGLTGITPDAAVHVGDSLATDVLGSANAGFASVLVRTTVPWPVMHFPPEPDATIDQLDELLTVLGAN